MSIVLGYTKGKIQVYSSYKPPLLIQSSIRDSSLWIPYSIHWIPDFLPVEFLPCVEFWIPWAETRFQDQGIGIPHAIFFFRIRNPNTFTWAEYKGETFSSSLRKVLWNVMIPASQFLTNELCQRLVSGFVLSIRIYFQPDSDISKYSLGALLCSTRNGNKILYNYPPKGKWIVVDIYIPDAKRRGI